METRSREAYIVCGAAGVGKSTYGARLAAERGATFLDIDTVSERLARVVLRQSGLNEDDRDSPTFKTLLREPIYETLFDIACENLRHQDVVIVAPFTRECKDPEWPQRLRNRLQVNVSIHFLACSAEAIRQRIVNRGNPRDEGKLEEWDAYLSKSLDQTPPPFPHTYIDTR